MSASTSAGPRLTDLIAGFRDHPGEIATVRLPSIEAGVMVRRRVREAFNDARVRGAEVEVYEERGLLGSTFAARLRGTDRQLLPALRFLAALDEEFGDGVW